MVNRKIGKRGFLLAEFTLKIIVAVLCIALLAFLFFKLYESFTDKSEVEKAGATLTRVVDGINNAILKGTDYYVLMSPKDWILLYSEEGKPLQCQGQRCLCLCEPEGTWSAIKRCIGITNCKDDSYALFKAQLARCDGAGVCKKIDKMIELPEMIAVNTTGVNFVYNSDKVVITKE